MLSRCRPFLSSQLSFLVTLMIPVLLFVASCSKPPAPVTGLSTALKANLPVYDPFTSAYPTAMSVRPVERLASKSDVFFSGKTTELRIKISTAQWGYLVSDFIASDNQSGIKRRAHLAVGEDLVKNVAVAVAGRGSLVAPEQDGVIQRSDFIIDFGSTFPGDATVYGSGPVSARPENLGRQYCGMSAMILKANGSDRTYLRSHLVSEMMLKFGVPTPRVGFAALHLDIEGRKSVYLGVYALHEVVDVQWFEENLGKVSCIFEVGKGDHGYGYLDMAEENEGHNRDKWCGRGLIGQENNTSDDPHWQGQLFHPTYAYKGGSDDCPTCQEHLNQLITSLVSGPLSEGELDHLIDTETVLRNLAVSAFSANVDDFWIYGNNAFLCRVQQGSKWQWTVVPIDYDLTFNKEFETNRNPSGSILGYGLGSTLAGQMLANEKYRSQYRDLILAWYMHWKENPVSRQVDEALESIRIYLRGYEAKDPNSFSKAAVLDLIRFCDGKMKMAEKELGLDK